MGQVIAKLNEKFLSGEDRSSSQESRGMLHDVTGDEADLTNVTVPTEGGDVLTAIQKTPPNVVKLKFDPRSPSDFDRTPIKLQLDD